MNRLKQKDPPQKKNPHPNNCIEINDKPKKWDKG